MRFLLLALTIVVTIPQSAAAVGYSPPVAGEIEDAYRQPLHPYGPGNRGVDYRSGRGEAVMAAAAGLVEFAGQAGGHLFVVVRHADGVRTTYGYLATITVAAGQMVDNLSVVGTSSGRLHFGARVDGLYVDPRDLFGARSRSVRLVPYSSSHSGAPPSSPFGLGAQPIPETTRAWIEGSVPAGCTPEDISVSPQPGRRLVVLVGGLGSSSHGASAFNIDTERLGYSSSDVIRFSYTGLNEYGPMDTGQPISTSARRLNALVARLKSDHPGVPVDVIAHSLGGVVARTALVQSSDELVKPQIDLLVTVGSPHRGAELAAARDVLDRTGNAWVDALLEASLHPALSNTAPAVDELSPASDFQRHLTESPLPAGVRILSVAAASDPVVSAADARLAGADNVIINAPGAGNPHGSIVRSSALRREILLAQAGLPRGCSESGRSAAELALSVGVRAATREVAAAIASWVSQTAPRPANRNFRGSVRSSSDRN